MVYSMTFFGLFVHVEEVFGEVYQVGLVFCTSQGGV